MQPCTQPAVHEHAATRTHPCSRAPHARSLTSPTLPTHSRRTGPPPFAVSDCGDHRMSGSVQLLHRRADLLQATETAKAHPRQPVPHGPRRRPGPRTAVPGPSQSRPGTGRHRHQAALATATATAACGGGATGARAAPAHHRDWGTRGGQRTDDHPGAALGGAGSHTGWTKERAGKG